MPKKLMFNPDNLYYETLKTTIQNHERHLPVAKNQKKAKAQQGEVKNAENSKTLFKQDKEKFVIPKSVQAIIPIKTI